VDGRADRRDLRLELAAPAGRVPFLREVDRGTDGVELLDPDLREPLRDLAAASSDSVRSDSRLSESFRLSAATRLISADIASRCFPASTLETMPTAAIASAIPVTTRETARSLLGFAGLSARSTFSTPESMRSLLSGSDAASRGPSLGCKRRAPSAGRIGAAGGGGAA